MTKSQRITLNADWWPAACRTQGWNSGDRELRLRVCSWAVSLENPTQAELLEAIHSDRVPAGMLTSCNDLNNRGDIDRVKACLGMLADNVKRTLEVGQPHYGSARRKRDLIRAHIKCLGLFEARPRAFVAVSPTLLVSGPSPRGGTLPYGCRTSPCTFPAGSSPARMACVTSN